MRTSLTYGHFYGIPLKVHLNWFLVAGLVVWSLAVGYFPQQYPGWGSLAYWVVSASTSLLFFLSVLLHELGHAIIAQQEGVAVNSITLFVFGGVAHIAREPSTPQAEFRIVIAGPFTSLLLAGVFEVVHLATQGNPMVSGAAFYLSRINFILAVFNLVPGFPLDGGRILRAAFWKATRSFCKATRWASNTGLAIALAFVVGGIALIFAGQWMSGLWFVFIGWYLSTAAHEGYRQSLENNPETTDIPESPAAIPDPQNGPANAFLEQPGNIASRQGQPAPAGAYGLVFALAQVVERRQKILILRDDCQPPNQHFDIPLNPDEGA